MNVGPIVARFTQGNSVVGQEELTVDTFTGDLQVTVSAPNVVGVVDGPVYLSPMFLGQGQVEIGNPGGVDRRGDE